MDTISRENNSMLPLIGVLLGGLALVLGAYNVVSLGKTKATVAAHETKLSQIPDDIASEVSAASTAASNVNSRVDSLTQSTQNAFTAVGNELGSIKADLTKLQESHHTVGAKGSHEPVVAGPGEYIVKPGDTGVRIARANGVSRADLLAVNPDVDWKHLKVGQKIKLPEKKS